MAAVAPKFSLSPGQAAYGAAGRDVAAFVRQHFAGIERSSALSPQARADRRFLAMAPVGLEAKEDAQWDELAALTGLSVPFLKAAGGVRAALSARGPLEVTDRNGILSTMAMVGPAVVEGGHLAALAEHTGKPLEFLVAASEWRRHYTPGGPVPPPLPGPAAAPGRSERLRLPL